MDDRSFDRLARLLGEARDRRTGLKALVGGILGAGGMAALDADADARRKGKGKGDAGPDAERRKKKRKKCNPACEGGFACVKGQCVCPSGIVCEGACCASGKACVDGACADAPEPGSCIAFGEPCKDTGRRCCAGMTCASGQGGSFPVACYMTKGAACERTAQCAYGMTCTNGVCLGNAGGGVRTGQPCATGQNCDQPGAVCTTYTGDDAPAGDFCTLPLRKVCSGDPDCTCYKCWYVNGGAQGASRASTNTKACCHPAGETCTTDNDCCYNLTCGSNGLCGGTMCVPQGGLAADGTCCTGLTVQNGVCAIDGGCVPNCAGKTCGSDGCAGTCGTCPTGQTCSSGTCTGGGGTSCSLAAAGQVGGACTPGQTTCPTDTTCTPYAKGAGVSDTDNRCLGKSGYATTDPCQCASYRVYDGKCTQVCDVYLTSGTADTDQARGAALKAALEARVATQESGYVSIEPSLETDPSKVKKYSPATEIALELNYTSTQASTGNDLVGLVNCFGGNSDDAPRPVISGGWSGGQATDGNRILNVTHKSGGTGRLAAQRVNFEAGNATGDGGAIRISTPGGVNRISSPTIFDYHSFRNVTVSGSRASGDGGCVWVDGPIAMGRTTLSACSAGGKGGGLYNKTQAVGSNTQYSAISGPITTFATGNQAAGGGAGVYWTGSNAVQFKCGEDPVKPVSLGSCAWNMTPTTSANCNCTSINGV